MVTWNRRFSSPQGYSRQDEKRDARQLVDEELASESGSSALLDAGSWPQPDEHVVLDLAPRVQPRVGIDLRAVAREAVHGEPGRPVVRRFAHQLRQLARQAVRWSRRVAQELGRRSLRAARVQGSRLFDWITWK